MYVAAVEALRKERGGETQFGGKTSLDPSYIVFANFHFQLRISCLIMTKLAILDPLIAWLYG